MWVIFALLTSMISATYYVCNQKCKLNAHIFMVYRGFFVALMALPLVLANFHVFPWQFYAIAVLQGLCVSYSDYRYFQVFHKFGAANVNAVTPLSVFVIFLLWLLLKPETIIMYMETPVRSAVICTSIALIIFSVIKYRNSKIGGSCLKEVFPLLFLSAMINISNKIIMEYNDGHLLLLTFNRVVITGVIIGIVNLLFARKYIPSFRELIKPENMRKGWFLFLMVMSMTTTNLAMHYAQNPAYVTSLFFTSVIWIRLYTKIVQMLGKNDSYEYVKIRWILLLLFACTTLLIATQTK